MSASLRQKIDHEWPAFSATSPLFLKMILDYTSRDAKLRIPKSFVKKYEKHLSNPVQLKLPSGSKWEVEVTTCDGEVWLDKGWPEFSKFYSLEQGGSLVFKYDGNSKFHVYILDASGTEIDYPLALPVMEETDEDDEKNSVEILEDYDDENDNSAEIFGDYQPCPKTSQKSGPLSRPLPRKKNRLSTHSSPEISSSSSKRVVEATNKFISNPSFRVTVGSSLMPAAFARENCLRAGDVCIFELIDKNDISLKVTCSDADYWGVCCSDGFVLLGLNLLVRTVCLILLCKAF